MLKYTDLDISVGLAAYVNHRGAGGLTTKFDRAANATQCARSTPVTIWPGAGAVGVPLSMATESPNRIPENNDAPAGYTISVQVNEVLRTLTATSFTLIDGSGAVVPTKLLSAATDTFMANNGWLNYIAALSRSPLAANTTNTATFVGEIRGINDSASVAGTPVTNTWSFTTGLL